MCLDCVKEEYPDRETVCIETGSYLMNFAKCAHCNNLGDVKIVNRTEEEEDGEELITYQHVCQECGHIIANHRYSFYVEDDEYQMYEMECLLCGRGEDSRSVMPTDPKHMQQLF
ncbi:protein Churchill [Lingula anatina]|uniref:Protein Churchill n=1 Tax=Lingula anatina TaxID=7574 RepID=A0A1S3JLC1_LINAN|nr:protein Churchill [Lingula anatina]|eukprot:XP_013411167.1 protein Churchill [Lingula anatina]